MREEKELWEAACAGSISAFEEILLRYEQRIFNYIHRMVRERQNAEDLTQETFIKVYRCLKRIDGDRSPAALIFKIATNTVYDFLRKQLRCKEAFIIDDPASDFETIDPDDPYLTIERIESAKILERTMDTLKPIYRSVLILYYQEDLSYHAIADTLDLPLNTVKTYMYRAKKALKGILEEKDQRYYG